MSSCPATEVLKSIYDPEIPINIYDLGLIYAVEANEAGVVDIKMTLTTPGCPVAQTFPGMVELMKNYVVSRSQWIDSSVAADSAIPHQPTIIRIGPPEYPIDRISFRVSSFSDPQGSQTFGALKWRVAEVTPVGEPAFDRLEAKLAHAGVILEPSNAAASKSA